MRISPTIAFAVALCVASGASAAPAPAKWAVNKSASRLAFRSAFAGQGFQGAFRRWEAQIAFDPKALAASKVVVTVDMASAATGDPTRDQALPTADWFDVRRFPTATFATTGFKDLGGGRYQALGTLTLRGVSKPIQFPFTLNIAGDQAKMTSSTSIDRSAFGVGQGQFKGADTLPFAVGLDISLVAQRAR